MCELHSGPPVLHNVYCIIINTFMQGENKIFFKIFPLLDKYYTYSCPYASHGTKRYLHD